MSYVSFSSQRLSSVEIYAGIYSDVRPEGLICSANLYDHNPSDANAASSKNAERPDLASGLFGATFVQCVRLTHEEQSILGFVFSVGDRRRRPALTYLAARLIRFPGHLGAEGRDFHPPLSVLRHHGRSARSNSAHPRGELGRPVPNRGFVILPQRMTC